MAKTITVQRYDNNIQLFFHITNNGVVEPIQGAEVYLKLINRETKQQYKRTVEIIDAELAECRYVLTRKDLEIVGVFDVEIETHYLNGTVLSTLEPPVTLVVTPEIVDQDGYFEDSDNSRQVYERQRPVPQAQPISRSKSVQTREEPSVIQFL